MSDWTFGIVLSMLIAALVTIALGSMHAETKKSEPTHGVVTIDGTVMLAPGTWDIKCTGTTCEAKRITPNGYELIRWEVKP